MKRRSAPSGPLTRARQTKAESPWHRATPVLSERVVGVAIATDRNVRRTARVCRATSQLTLLDENRVGLDVLHIAFEILADEGGKLNDVVEYVVG